MPLHSSWVWIKGGRRGKVTAGQGWRRRYENRNNRVSCHRWQAKVIKLRKACVHSWFKPSCRLCLVFCSFLMPTALLIEWPPLLSALRENPISGMITVPSYCCCCADQCSDEVSGPGPRVGALNSFLPRCFLTESLIHIGRVLQTIWGLTKPGSVSLIQPTAF